MIDKRLSLKEAIAEYVQDDLSVAIEGFTAFICFAAGHEIIRQHRRNLTLIRMTPDVIYDQMVVAERAPPFGFLFLCQPPPSPFPFPTPPPQKNVTTPPPII